MRKLIVSTMMSTDGYVEGPGKNVMALPIDAFFDEHNLERLRSADTLLLGAITYQGMRRFWPSIAEDPTRSPAVVADPSVADLHRETGERNGSIEKVVVSDTLTADDTAPWTETTTIVPRAEAHRVVADLKDRPGRDIVTFGSRTLWNDLLAAGLVDEMQLLIGAGVIGGGTPAFGPGASVSLRLVETRNREGSDTVLLRYEVTA